MHSDCFHDNLAFAAGLFTVDDASDDAALPAATLADATALGPLLAAHGRTHGADEPRAIASQWSKYAFARLIIPTVVLQCSLDRAVDFTAARWRLVVDADGTPARFVFDAEPLGRPGTGSDLASLIDDVMRPLIAALCGAARLAPRIYGSNAAMYYVWALEQLEAQHRGRAAPLGAARALLAAPVRPDGGFNPFNAPDKALPPGTCDGNGEPVRRCRRLCCVRDLDPVWDLCPNCPRAMQYVDTPALAEDA